METWGVAVDRQLSLNAGASIHIRLTFLIPAHRTGQAQLTHPALGERFTVSPTESYSSAG